MIRRPPRTTLFPSTTLLRSQRPEGRERVEAAEDRRGDRRHVGEPDQDRREGDRQRPGDGGQARAAAERRSEEHTSELQSRQYLVCRLLLDPKHVLSTRLTGS